MPLYKQDQATIMEGVGRRVSADLGGAAEESPADEEPAKTDLSALGIKHLAPPPRKLIHSDSAFMAASGDALAGSDDDDEAEEGVGRMEEGEEDEGDDSDEDTRAPMLSLSSAVVYVSPDKPAVDKTGVSPVAASSSNAGADAMPKAERRLSLDLMLGEMNDDEGIANDAAGGAQAPAGLEKESSFVAAANARASDSSPAKLQADAPPQSPLQRSGSSFLDAAEQRSADFKRVNSKAPPASAPAGAPEAAAPEAAAPKAAAPETPPPKVRPVVKPSVDPVPLLVSGLMESATQAADGAPGANGLMTSALCDQIRELCAEVQMLHAEHDAIFGALCDGSEVAAAHAEAKQLAKDAAERRRDSLFAPPTPVAPTEPSRPEPTTADRRLSREIYGAQFNFLAKAESEEDAEGGESFQQQPAEPSNAGSGGARGASGARAASTARGRGR